MTLDQRSEEVSHLRELVRTQADQLTELRAQLAALQRSIAEAEAVAQEYGRRADEPLGEFIRSMFHVDSLPL